MATGWALTTAVIDGTPYSEKITPLTFPLMERYAARWGMEFKPYRIAQSTMGEKSPAPAGTGADYQSIPYRISLLDHHEGVVFLDSDVVCVDQSEDICLTVDDDQPIGSVNGCGVVVMKHGELAHCFLESIWAMRHHYATYQWLEQAAFCELVGVDGTYPGDGQPSRYIGPTAWTHFVREIDPKWNHGPNAGKPCHDYRFLHPFGVQPFSVRLQLIESAVQQATQLAGL